MSTYIDLDSTYRVRNDYPNPANYVVTAEQTDSWPKENRRGMSHSSRPGSRVLDFTQSAQVCNVTLPYTAITYVNNEGTTINSHTADLRRIYLDIHSEGFDDKYLMYSIENHVSSARFVLFRDGIQTDSNGDNAWVMFKTCMDQVLRFSRKEPVIVRLMTYLGFTIVINDNPLPDPVDPSVQTYILLELTPYTRDSDYDNHALQLRY